MVRRGRSGLIGINGRISSWGRRGILTLNVF